MRASRYGNVSMLVSCVYTLSKYADKMLMKNHNQRTLIGEIQLIICKLKVNFHNEATCCVLVMEAQPQVSYKSAYIEPGYIIRSYPKAIIHEIPSKSSKRAVFIWTHYP